MTLLILGMNHRTASQMLRGRVAFSAAQLTTALPELVALEGVREAVIVSTCNRTELYVAMGSDAAASTLQVGRLQRWLEGYHDLPAGVLDDHLYLHRDIEAVAHGIRVASGLDSLILGEPQIFGQFKAGYQYAQAAGTLGQMLDRLFQHTFAAVKQIRTCTDIGMHSVSIASTAVQLAGRIFDRFERTRALLIGAGDTIALVARHLKSAGVKSIVIANRTLSHAQRLAREIEAEAILLDEIPTALERVDIVISSTASPLPIISRDMVQSALKVRRHAPLFIADIAVPCDVDSAVGRCDDVFLYALDDFNDILDDNRLNREQAARAAERVIEQSVQQWQLACRLYDIGPLIQRHRQQAEQVRQAAEAQALAQLARGQPPEEVVQRLSQQLTNRLLHVPTARLREATRERREDILAAFEQLLLESPVEATPEPPQGTRSR